MNKSFFYWVSAVIFVVNCLSTTRADEVSPDSVVTLQMPANDLVYSSATQRIYASVAGEPNGVAGSLSGTITIIDPATATIEKSIPIGKNPNKLALSSDGKTLYVALTGESAVRRFDTITQTAGSKFTLNSNYPGYPTIVHDMAVRPGSNNVVALVAGPSGSSGLDPVAVYVDGVQRGAQNPIFATVGLIEWASPERLYGFNNVSTGFEFSRLKFSATGLELVDRKETGIQAFYEDMLLSGGEIYSGNRVINPETGLLHGTFALYGNFERGLCPDASLRRVCFLMENRLLVYHRPTFRLVGEMEVPEATFHTPMVRWGNDGLAWISKNTFGPYELCLARTSLLHAPLPKAAPIPVNPEINGLRRVDLPANHLIYDAARREILASVSASPQGFDIPEILKTPYHNSITPLDPFNGEVGAPVFIGSNPQKIVLADDDKTLWTALFGAGAVRRYDVETRQAGSRFSLREPGTLNQAYPEDLAVQPGQPTTVAVALQNLFRSPRHEGVAVYDNGVQRPLATERHTGSNIIRWSDNSNIVYGHNSETSENGFRRMAIGPQGITVEAVIRRYELGGDFVLFDGRAYFNRGTVLNLQSGNYEAPFRAGGDRVCLDTNLGRIYFLSGLSGKILRVYDIATRALIGEQLLPDVHGAARSLVRWGDKGLAFVAEAYDSNKIWLYRSALVNENQKLTITISPNAVKETAGANAATATLSRNFNFQNALTVQLFSNRPTNVAIPTTVTIPAGQSSVTFPVGVKNNTVAEGSRLALITARAPNWVPDTGRLTIYDDEARLWLSVMPLSFTENAGAQAAKATVTRNTSTEAPLRVQLSSSDRSEISVPGAVVIPAGASSVTFFVAAVNDDEVDGPQTPIITAYLTGYAPGRQQIEVRDEDRPALNATLSKPTISETAGPYAALLTVTRNAKLSESLTVTLQNNQPGRIKVPVSVTIAAGARRASVWVATINNSVANEDQIALLRAVATFFAPGQAQLTIKDDD